MENLSWTTLEYEEKNRGRDWVWYVGLITAIAATLAFFYNNIFFGILLVIFGIFIIFLSIRKPRSIEVLITKESISIGERVIKIEDITKFWVDESEKHSKLLLLTKNGMIPVLVVLIENVKNESVKEMLSPLIKESFLREPTSDKIFQKLGF